jgi:hypothetical protein
MMKIMKRPPKAQSGEVPILSEENTVPGPCCVTYYTRFKSGFANIAKLMTILTEEK